MFLIVILLLRAATESVLNFGGVVRRRSSFFVWEAPDRTILIGPALSGGKPLAYRAIYAYAWDLAERGVPATAEDMVACGINTITLASSYHAGKFIRPRGRTGKVFFPEDGTTYFRPDEKAYGELKPQASSLVAKQDILHELCDSRAVVSNAWLVLLHNTRMGEAHPEATVANAFGDRYLYSLCPSSPAVREYAVALCKDVTDHYAVSGISLETPGFLPYEHGFHHEFALMRQNVWFNNLMGLCFCDYCVAGAEAAGIDATALKAKVREEVNAYLESDLDYPNDMAAAFWHSDTLLDADLSNFLRWRCTVVTSLVQDIRDTVRSDATVAVIPSVARPTAGAWFEGSDLGALARAAGTVEACFYEPGLERIRSDILDVQRRMRGAGRLRGVLRPGFPDLTTRQEVIDAVAALVAAGIEDIAFYNYGHLRQASLDWMRDALTAIGK